MKFTLIDMNNWDRKEYFEHYYQNIPCTYSMSVKLDITSLKQQGKHLYSTLLFFLTQIINQHREFRFSFDNQGRLGYFDEMLPNAVCDGFHVCRLVQELQDFINSLR